MSAEFDLREAFNVVSDVIVNRPSPLREFDQIHMKVADMLLQAEHVSKWLDGKRTLFVGDGDALGLTMLHLKSRGVLQQGPSFIHVLDFDERVLHSIERFAGQHGLSSQVSVALYNVADALPAEYCRAFDGFYTNPPFGSANEGESVCAFVMRGIEGTSDEGVGCVVAADSEQLPWSGPVLLKVQRLLADHGFVISEMIPAFHSYHLHDVPKVTSCSLIARRIEPAPAGYLSFPQTADVLASFYGRSKPLTTRYVRDKTQGGDSPSLDYKFEPFADQKEPEEGGFWQ